ncbi:MAG: hypothetical protein JNL10_12290 [Verrucomicrobiales bacterium]|nr:hypothetical protein [Verrucomicrobiales bacterium]
MNRQFQCPSCGAPLGAHSSLSTESPPACPHCGWRSAPAPTPSRLPRELLKSVFAGLAGILLGALIGHSQLMALFLFLALGPLATIQIARKTTGIWWLQVLVYSAALAIGMILWNDGQTVSAGDWRAPASGAILSAVSGILAGLLGRPA